MLSARVTDIETIVKGDREQDDRIGKLEYRLGWMDDEKNRDRNERKQIDRDLLQSLERLNNAVTRLEAWITPIRRR
jgi:anti-sigma-K factor RskA